MPPQFYNNSIFYVETDKIRPNPYQPRHEFNEEKLRELADSIRQYGILQPLVVTRHEESRDDGLSVHYELIAGERRLRASKLLGLAQVPVVIRASEETNRMKLELAIIENLQREDLNPIDRALAFKKLAEEFGFKHGEIAQKVGKSREYVSNTLRLLALPEDIITALKQGDISEGHARPLGMLADRKDEQTTLFREIMIKKLSVREAEQIARRIAQDRVRNKTSLRPEYLELEEKLTTALGTRVRIDLKEVGGRVLIDFFSNDDLQNLIERLKNQQQATMAQPVSDTPAPVEPVAAPVSADSEDANLYSVRNFSV